jgi:hypothetical protein
MVTDINYYTEFRRVCRVQQQPGSGDWYYTDCDHDLLYSEHRSWVYIITVNGQVYKIGETGNPLGIRGREEIEQETQPRPGTTSRLGRYRRGCGTDQHCRYSLRDQLATGDLVEFWAYQCPELVSTPVILEGVPKFTVRSQMHKQLEVRLIDNYYASEGCYPPLNKARC